MKLEVKQEPFPHIIIYNYFTEDELNHIWKELKFLTNQNKLLPPSETGSAMIDGVLTKQNKGLFLDEIFPKREISDILTYSKKIFENNDLRKQISDNGWVFRWWNESIGRYVTLLSYYENSDYYDPHEDYSFFTNLIHLFEEPISFKGGELYFPDFDYTLPNVNNRMFIFPSNLTHEVKPITMNVEEFSGKGRYTITHFCSSK